MTVLGNWQLDTASGGTFSLDGGAMFGVVPKPLWERSIAADERNRIPLGTNCVLARNGDYTVLIDTGYGHKHSDKAREQMQLAAGEPLVESLAALGVAPDQIDYVVFSHLHFDHAGGATRLNQQGKLTTTFPRATYVANRLEWADATSQVPELHGSYPLENLLPIDEAGQLRLIDDGDQIVPGLRARHTGGHTRGHHTLIFESQNQHAIYLGDLCPTHAHLPVLWCMGYDTYLLDTRRQKPQVLGDAADQSWLVLWDHDHTMAAARIVRDDRRDFIVAEKILSL